MKRTIILICCSILIYSCGNNNTETKETQPPTAKAQTQSPEALRGLELVANSDCLSCHSIEDPMSGPAYKAIANKYENNPTIKDQLAGKIITGGSGNWGSVPMTAHPTLSKEDAKAMVEYIMSLKDDAGTKK